MTRPARPGEAGFTLIEVLVATALAGLLSAMLLGGVQIGGRVLEKSGAQADRQSQLWSVSDTLRGRLAAALPLEDRQPDGGRTVRFAGRSDSLTFVSQASPWQAFGGAQELTLHTAGRAGSLALVADWRPERGDASTRSSRLLDDLAAAEFGYFGVLAGQRQAAWHASWEGQPALPALIRLRLRLADGRRPPELLVAPRLTRATADD